MDRKYHEGDPWYIEYAFLSRFYPMQFEISKYWDLLLFKNKNVNLSFNDIIQTHRMQDRGV